MTYLDTDFPLDSCRDCLHREDCDLMEELNEVIDRHIGLDISYGFCSSYEEDEDSLDETWRTLLPLITENEDDPIMFHVGDLIESLNISISEIKERGYEPQYIHMSHETMKMFTEDDITGKVIKTLKTGHGVLEVVRDETIEEGYFLVTFLSDEG